MALIKRYVPDLKELHSIGERNYAVLSKLLPAKTNQFKINVGEHSVFELQVVYEATYTSDIEVKQSFVGRSVPDILPIEFIVRLYHDAKMAEIIDCQGASALTSIRKGSVPKRANEQDEKRQLALFLKDWLTLCTQEGRVDYDWRSKPLPENKNN